MHEYICWKKQKKKNNKKTHTHTKKNSSNTDGSYTIANSKPFRVPTKLFR